MICNDVDAVRWEFALVTCMLVKITRNLIFEFDPLVVSHS